MRNGWRPRWSGWLLCLALTLALAGCAPNVTTGAKVTPSPSASARAVATATRATSAFVCANPAGSSAIYAYVQKGGALSIVEGCTPRLVAAPAGRQLTPVAFSPTGMRLMVWNNEANPQGPDTQSCLNLVDVGSLAVTPTRFCSPGTDANQAAQWLNFIGWASDASFYLADTAQDGSVTVLFVSLPQETQAVVTKLTWVAGVAAPGEPSGVMLRGEALFFGGYMSASEGGAYLHRYSLTTQVDTRLVRLGLAGAGGCQGTEAPCNWTGPWDVSPDGSQIAYHVPGPTQSLSDTSTEQGTPLYVANSDGAGATRLFPGTSLGHGGFAQPTFSPDGRYIVATFPGADVTQPPSAVFERLSDGSLISAPTGWLWWTWTAQSGVAVMGDPNALGEPGAQPALYNVATGARMPLQADTSNYVWLGTGG